MLRRNKIFFDGRDSMDITTITGPARTVDDDQDDEMSEPTQMSSVEKTTGGRNDKRVTGIITRNRFVTHEFITAW